MSSKGSFYSGTSNVVLPVRNKAYFPPEYQDKTRLAYYASLFNSVEINSTFYKLPLAQTVTRWSDEVPDNFRFSFKLFKGVTHSAKAIFNLKSVPEFLTRIGSLKRGCLLIQLPPKFSVDLFQLGQLLELAAGSWPLAVEFRHPGWYRQEVFALLRDHGASMVLQDIPRSASPMELTSKELVYLRFHGPESGYRGTYSDAYLAEYAAYISEWMASGMDVYAYFNNTLGNAVQNLMTLNNFVFG